MSSKLFDEDDSDNDLTLKTSSSYAQKYNTLRRKEELLKLKNRLGADAVENQDTSSSSEDDDEDVILSEDFERNFFQTLSYLKKKDPKIYDQNVRFFDSKAVDEPSTSKNKNSKAKPYTIRDYNREAILETEGKFSDNEEGPDDGRKSPTLVQEQKQIKKMFSSVLENDDEGDGDIGGMFVKKKKSKEEEAEEERKYHEWLSGEASNLKDENEEKALRALKDYWNNPQLDEGEAFLRDYFLNQRFKENSNKDYIPSYDEIVNDPDDVSEDEKLVGQQTEFEHKFNFRFEEPDQDFIKRYPRTLEHSVRQKDNKRAKKRTEVKQRKEEEKQKKKEEIAQLKSLKLKEIQEKIEKLKEITGNDQLAFKDEDIEGDFDPDEHDKRMKELFNDEFYDEDNADANKPEFPDIDEELEIENWDEWNANDEYKPVVNGDGAELHCEDENFNMDCDYDPSQTKNDLLSKSKEAPEGRRRKRKRKNKLAEILAKKKPVFDPEKMDKTFAEYLDEYYKLDCEDVIGDMPCRFKYREVPPCDYGLTTAEILMADDDELNRWYPLKKTLQYRPQHKQLNDQHVYSSKSKNLELKKKILPSLFQESNENADSDDETNEGVKTKKKRNKKKRRKSNKSFEDSIANNESSTSEKHKKKKPNISNGTTAEIEKNIEQSTEINQSDSKKKKTRHHRSDEVMDSKKDVSITEVNSEVKSKKKTKNDTKIHDVSIVEDSSEDKSEKKKKRKKVDNDCSEVTDEIIISKQTSKYKKSQDVNEDSLEKNSKKRQRLSESDALYEGSPVNKKKKKKNKNKHQSNENSDSKNKQNEKQFDSIKNISDERLAAYGLNPKKYRNFIKYKKH